MKNYEANMNLQTIIRTLSFHGLEKYAEELNVNFASEDSKEREEFRCDFIMTFLYENKYFCYCIVRNPQTTIDILVITVRGHFLYQGNSFNDALARVAQLYNKYNTIIEKN